MHHLLERTEPRADAESAREDLVVAELVGGAEVRLEGDRLERLFAGLRALARFAPVGRCGIFRVRVSDLGVELEDDDVGDRADQARAVFDQCTAEGDGMGSAASPAGLVNALAAIARG